AVPCLPRYTLTRGVVATEDCALKPREGHGESARREPVPAVSTALSQWTDITSPRKVTRSGIPASGI
ncbi:dihydropyrimidinase, partial [Rhizobium ruizarguesonis]